MNTQGKEDVLIFYTSNEVADILKMHPQVIARKLQSGEMEGYKLGKDWRVSKEQLLRFLEKHSNQNQKKNEMDKGVEAFFENGKLKSIPAARSKRLPVLKYLVSKLEPRKVYNESEINDFLSEYHSDFCTLRREMIINKLMVRSDGHYKVVGWNK